MERYYARDFFSMSEEEKFGSPNRKIKLVFDDGEVECYWRIAVLSSYCWFIHQENDLIPLTQSLLVQPPYDKKSCERVWNKILFQIKDDWGNYGLDYESISKTIFKSYNLLYNAVCNNLARYTTSSNARELREIIHHPIMESYYQELISLPQDQKIHRKLDELYKKVTKFLRTHPDMRHNGFARSIRVGLVDGRQFLQVVFARGYTEDIDNYQFKTPIRAGYGRGIHDILWLAQESRGASHALIATTDPVQTSDYLNRRLQGMTEIIRGIKPGDCGSTYTIPWYIEEGGLGSALGLNYVDEDGSIKEVTKEDKHLVGKTLNVRTAAYCKHLKDSHICETCFGSGAKYIPFDYSIGHISVISALGAFVQKNLSTKHLIVSRDQIEFVFDENTARYLKFPKADNHNELVLQPKVLQNKDKTVSFIFRTEDLKFLGDIQKDIQIDDIQIYAASSVGECSINIQNKANDNLRDILTVSDIGRRAHLSREFIEYILNNRHLVDVGRSSVKISLDNWDYKATVFNIPYRITGVNDFMAMFERTIKNGCIKFNITGNTPSGVSDMMRLCYNIIKAQVNVPVAHLGVMLATMLIRSKDNMDYRLPEHDGEREFDTMGNIYGYRSVSQMMAYERRLQYLCAPSIIMVENRPDHPFDTIYFPEIANPYADVEKAKEKGYRPARYL